uniref:E3 ubiquitin-protein ligase RNF182 n=1 Tax=Geotrypetes seraphini TaxID=260995 RepID=A0A6P8STC7_GEOSA|nr:E3 ubiquitin-protein ligase RNF182-like [Geotrypetes seraphini]
MIHKDGELESSQPLVCTTHELECKICYNCYDTRHRKPKLLNCHHKVCAKCLKKIVDIGDLSPNMVSCPFCRQETCVPDEDIQMLQDDSKIITVLTHQERTKKRGVSVSPEVILSPSGLEPFNEQSHSSSDCLVITIMEMPEDSSTAEGIGVLDIMRLYRPPSLDSLPCHCPAQKCHSCTWRTFPRFIIGLLCLVYFSSLPLGIYLLMIKHLTLGIVLVSLVPSTLILCVLYGFCQCLCHELIETFST